MSGDSAAEEGAGGQADAPVRSESPRARFVAALAVRRNAAVGLVAGTAVAATVFWVFVLDPPETRFSPVLYLLLAFTVALATAALVALALTLVRAVRLWYDLEDAEE